MMDETRIRQVMELINSETDPQKVKILAAELARLLSEKRSPISVSHQKAAVN